MSPLLEAHGVGVRIGDAVLLDRIDLSVPPGELTAIVGPNGAGKSTLLAALSGELRPTAGTVALAGAPVQAYGPRDLALRRAVLPQASNLQFHFTVDELVRLGYAVAREVGSDRDIGAVVETAMTETDVSHLKDRLVPTLSGGERQRAHLARCLAQLHASPVRGPKALLLDEPTASLDPAHQHLVMDLARRLADRGHGVIAVVHDLNLAAAHADRLVILSGGTLHFDGSVEDGLTSERLARTFNLDADILVHPRTGRPLVAQCGAVRR